MPRDRRIHYDQAIYHVMLRGNFKSNVFHEEADFNYFLKRMQHAVEKFSCKIHLYCLMTNYIHMVIEVSYVPLGKIMQSITSPFTRNLNKKYVRKGHVFEE